MLYQFLKRLSKMGFLRKFKTKKDGDIVPQYVKNGYSYVKLIDKNGVETEHRVDILVAKAFVPNPNNYANVRHIDGDTLNSSADNLEWVE